MVVKKTVVVKTPLERKFKLYRALKQYRDRPDADIWAMAQSALERDAKAALDADKLPKGADPLLAAKFSNIGEQREAQTLWLRYMGDYSLESPSEQATLRDIVYLEIVQCRLQRKLNLFEDEEIKTVPYDLMDAMHRNADVIVKLKTALGLNKSKDKLHGYDAFQHLMKRHRGWLAQNQASRYMKCSHCLKPNLLIMRTAAWESFKHPWFADNMIYNKHLFAHLGQTVLIDAKFISDVLGTSPDYIDWVLDKSRQGAQVTAAAVAAQLERSTSENKTTSVEGESQVQPQG